MPQYKDTERNTWFCKFSYQDWQGQRRQKLKRGFHTKREAAAYERDFLDKQQGNPDMTFQALYVLYIEDMKHRLKASTISTKHYTYMRYIVPYFKDKPINQITPPDIRKWQNEILTSVTKETYQRQIYNQLNAVLNYAVRYYGLLKNPCSVTGSIGKLKADRMEFWTCTEFNRFVNEIHDITMYTAYTTLYYTGMRCGELLALNLEDINLQSGTISITKTYHRIKKMDVITPPKTAGSVRSITIPSFLVNILKEYFAKIYGLSSNNRVFQITRSKMITAMKNACSASQVKQIRIHDIRHPYVKPATKNNLLQKDFGYIFVQSPFANHNFPSSIRK